MGWVVVLGGYGFITRSFEPFFSDLGVCPALSRLLGSFQLPPSPTEKRFRRNISVKEDKFWLHLHNKNYSSGCKTPIPKSSAELGSKFYPVS